jgi:hypothetical protein
VSTRKARAQRGFSSTNVPQPRSPAYLLWRRAMTNPARPQNNKGKPGGNGTVKAGSPTALARKLSPNWCGVPGVPTHIRVINRPIDMPPSPLQSVLSNCNG